MAETIRVNFKSYDLDQVNIAIKEMTSVVNRTGASIIGPIPLPTKKERFCVLRSPHVDKKSREHFELRIHKRLLYIINYNKQMIDSLQTLEVSSGVKVDIKT